MGQNQVCILGNLADVELLINAFVIFFLFGNSLIDRPLRDRFQLMF